MVCWEDDYCNIHGSHPKLAVLFGDPHANYSLMIFFFFLFSCMCYSYLRTMRWSFQTATKVVSPLEHCLGENTRGTKLSIMCTLQVKGGGCIVFSRRQGYQLELLNPSSPRLHLISLGEIGFRCGWTTVIDDDGRQRLRLLLQPNDVQMFWYIGCDVGMSHHLPMLVILVKNADCPIVYILIRINYWNLYGCEEVFFHTRTLGIFLTLVSLRTVSYWVGIKMFASQMTDIF